MAQEQLQKQQLKQQVDAIAASAIGLTKSTVTVSATNSVEMAAKLEEQLKQQRIAMAQKRLAADVQNKTSQGLVKNVIGV